MGYYRQPIEHSQDVVYVGPGLGTITFIVFLILKLIGVVTFSWFWVFFPLWIAPATILGIIILVWLISIPFFLIHRMD